MHPARVVQKELDMTVCERCGKEIPEQRTICPSCGTSLEETQVGREAVSDHPPEPTQEKTHAFPFDSLYEEYIPQLAPIYERNYAAHPINPHGTSSAETPSGEQEKPASAMPAVSSYSPATLTERFFNVDTNTPLVVEVLLSLFMGIFGVGWLLIGKKRTGTLLLTGSLICYLPLLIISYALAYFSYGLSILCTGPFVIGVVLLNAFMLHKAIKRKRASSR